MPEEMKADMLRRAMTNLLGLVLLVGVIFGAPAIYHFGKDLGVSIGAAKMGSR